MSLFRHRKPSRDVATHLLGNEVSSAFCASVCASVSAEARYLSDTSPTSVALCHADSSRPFRRCGADRETRRLFHSGAPELSWEKSWSLSIYTDLYHVVAQCDAQLHQTLDLAREDSGSSRFLPVSSVFPCSHSQPELARCRFLERAAGHSSHCVKACGPAPTARGRLLGVVIQG